MLTAAQQYIEDRVERIPECGCWLWTRSTVIGIKYELDYGRAYFNDHAIYAHRLAWEAYRGPIPDGLRVLHHCDVRCCCNPYHLFLGTNRDNTHDAIQKGRHSHGDRHGMRKLTDELRQQIDSSTESGLVLSRRIGVNHSTVNRYRRGDSWKHLKRSRAISR